MKTITITYDTQVITDKRKAIIIGRENYMR